MEIGYRSLPLASADMSRLFRYVVTVAAAPIFTALVFSPAQAADDALIQVSYAQVLTEYTKDATAAGKQYDGRRLVFKGEVYPLSDNSLNTLAVTEGFKVGARFQDDQRAALQSVFPGGKLVAYQPSKTIAIDCLNRQFVGLTLALADCRVAQP
ncbi:hypothetical protein CJO79_19515 (plasmid) [Ralstonia solanacearum]|nr:hypothetical protein CJO76_19530 [Ralstonia solanacearum]AXV93180.1 hypothetical protein CJO79_19515 [Ralstonia solanacearum]AXW21229.1 hypothetical protein CJO85_19585 [Ralstonia solanacearum]AXW78075.1 hypothetical protein CJO97_19510 [Ralstonia solanacearum]